MNDWIDIDIQTPADGEEVLIRYETGEVANAVACWFDDSALDGWMVNAMCFGDFIPPKSRVVQWKYPA